MIREFEDRDSKNRIVAEEKKILRNSRRTIEAESIPLERKNLRNEEEKRWKARGGRNSLVQLVITDYGLKLRPWRIEIRRIWSEKGRSLMFKSRNEETFLRVTSACRSRWQRSIQILFRAHLFSLLFFLLLLFLSDRHIRLRICVFCEILFFFLERKK